VNLGRSDIQQVDVVVAALAGMKAKHSSTCLSGFFKSPNLTKYRKKLVLATAKQVLLREI